MKRSRILCIAWGFGMLLAAVPGFSADASGPPSFDSLKNRLLSDGFDKNLLTRVFDGDTVRFETGVISIYFRHREKGVDYSQYLAEPSIRKARRYLIKHAPAFAAMEKALGVQPEIVAAILLVETQFGEILGWNPAAGVLSTLAVLSEPAARDYVMTRVLIKGETTPERFGAWADRKAPWAYEELSALLTFFSRDKKADIFMKGSFAGAVGICQFMPTNILKYGADGDGDGRVDLFTPADAIFSTASYLKGFGWEKDQAIDARKAVLFEYNRSDYYVDILIKITETLSEGS